MLRHWPYLVVFGLGVLATLAFEYFRHLGQTPAAEAGPQKVDLSITSGGTYRVARVVDGDTVVLENGLHVRYAGVNTPEAGRFIKDPAPISREATARNRQLVEGKLARLTLGETPVDAYGRVVAHVEALPAAGPAVDVEAVLLSEGLGRVLALGLPPEEYQRLKALQDQAKAAQAGLWGVARASGEDPAAARPYCAASGGKVFHRSDCPQAQHIAPANLQTYRTLEEALATGRRPCTQCLKSEVKPPDPEAAP